MTARAPGPHANRPAALALAAAMLLAGCLGASGAVDGPDAANNDPDRPAAGAGSIEAGGAPYAPGWPALEDAVIRPGVGIHNRTYHGQNAWECTANFIFASPDNRTLYIGTASHCFHTSSPLDVGDEVDIAHGAAKGELVYSSWATLDTTYSENDFALVRIQDAYRHLVHPAVHQWGGPTGVVEAPLAPGDRVLAYENTWFRQHEHHTNPREGYVTDASEWVTRIHTGVPGIYGDSGSPVLAADGRALGTLVHWNTATQENGASNLAPALAYMAAHTNLTVELVTWPLLREGVLPEAPTGAGSAGALG